MWLAIGDAVEHWARYYPQRPAVIVGDQVCTYQELCNSAQKVGAAILQSSCKGRIAVAVRDKRHYLACLVGINRIGRSSIVINSSEPDEALRVHLADTMPALLIGDSQMCYKVQSFRLPNEPICIEMPDNVSTADVPKPDSKQAEWGVLFSSGTTGISKAIVYDHLAMTSELLAWCLELGIRRDTWFYIGRPVCYTGGLVVALSTLLVGGTVITPEHTIDSDFKAIWHHYQNCIRNYKLNFAFFVPDQLRLFITLTDNTSGGPTILVMGAPITADEKISASKVLMSPVIESWGNTEGLGTITDIDDLVSRPRSIGRPFVTEKLYVMQDHLGECPIGTIGRLAGLDETMFTEYANRKEATQTVKKQNLVFSDDIGYMDSDGYFYIQGRDQESFIVNGKQVFLSEIDRVVRNVAGVSDVCTLADCRSGITSFHLIVIPNDVNSLVSLEKRIHASIEMPINGITYASELPRLSSGKLDRIAATQLRK